MIAEGLFVVVAMTVGRRGRAGRRHQLVSVVVVASSLDGRVLSKYSRSWLVGYRNTRDLCTAVHDSVRPYTGPSTPRHAGCPATNAQLPNTAARYLLGQTPKPKRPILRPFAAVDAYLNAGTPAGEPRRSPAWWCVTQNSSRKPGKSPRKHAAIASVSNLDRKHLRNTLNAKGSVLQRPLRSVTQKNSERQPGSGCVGSAVIRQSVPSKVSRLASGEKIPQTQSGTGSDLQGRPQNKRLDGNLISNIERIRTRSNASYSARCDLAKRRDPR